MDKRGRKYGEQLYIPQCIGSDESQKTQKKCSREEKCSVLTTVSQESRYTGLNFSYTLAFLVLVYILWFTVSKSLW